MTGEDTRSAADHLREALEHLREARDGSLRKTHAVAIEETERTLARVLSEHEQDD